MVYKLQFLSLSTVVNFQNNRKIWFSCIDKALLSDGNIQFKLTNGFISVIRTLLRRKQCLSSYILILNALVHKFSSCSVKHQKTPQTGFGRSWIEFLWDSRGVEEIRRQCIHYFASTFVNEKAVFKVDAAFAHSRSKTTTRRLFRAYFVTFSTIRKWFCG